MSRINGAGVQPAPDDRWYADVPASATQPTNLLTGGTLSLRLAAFTGATASSTESITLTADQPLVHHFTTAGSIPSQITHSLNVANRNFYGSS